MAMRLEGWKQEMCQMVRDVRRAAQARSPDALLTMRERG